jgi:hypothetical protein
MSIFHVLSFFVLSSHEIPKFHVSTNHFHKHVRIQSIVGQPSSQPLLSPLNYVGHFSILARITSTHSLHSAMQMLAPHNGDL